MKRYVVFDAAHGEYLASFKKPVKGLDVAVTQWTEDPEGAMGFKVCAAARSAAAWLDDGSREIEILEERGETP